MEDGRETGRETVNHQLRVANLPLEAHCNATMPHGDFSDISGLALFAGGVQMMGWPRASPISASPHPPPRPNPVPLAPEMLFAEVGPFKAFLPGVSADERPSLVVPLMQSVSYVTRWIDSGAQTVTSCARGV